MTITRATPSKVVVIGGGVIGLCAAFFLRREGAQVTVVERSSVGGAASHRNAGWIVPIYSGPLPAPGLVSLTIKSLLRPDSPVYIKPRLAFDLIPWLWQFWRHCNERDFLNGLHATARLAERSLKLYDELAGDGVQFEMRSDGLLFAFLDPQKAKHTLEGLEPMSEHGYELPKVALPGDELRQVEPTLSDDVRAGFLIPEERHVFPETLMSGLADRLREMGVEILEGSPVQQVKVSKDRMEAIRTPLRLIEGDAFLLCTGAWTTEFRRTLQLRIPLQPGKGYSFSVQPSVMPRHPLYLGEARVGCTPLGRRLRIAGTMELSGLNDRIDSRRVSAIRNSARRFLKTGLDDLEVQDVWTGMRPMTPDGLPVIDRAPNYENVFVATGHAMLGITLGPPTGEAVAEHMTTGHRPDVLKPFTINRFS